ncbi:NCS2 family permease [Miniphocaeibacter halophilus]|uniref:NCS2 family permease n=1 Tax=Miniphocaeibacter halophilus TaxID=2931922 RepID=A0AC61MS41_9FIRM|nr:NCS2 family permease [Miniphocaeibacter halophilus]QQK08128.1 NCS2 family permease [Miniphocaeibacter halophilus]
MKSNKEVVNGGFLEKIFLLKKNNTSIKTEVLAGITTFVTMAYVLGTIPNMMATAGLDKGVILTSMVILIVLTSVAMAIVTNRPFALGPGLSSVGIVAGMISNEGIPIEVAQGVIFWSGIIFVVISYLGVRDAVVKAIPASLKHSVSAGVGLFIALLGCRNAGIIVGVEGKNYLAFGDFTSIGVILAIIGFILILVTKTLKVPGYMIVSIIITTLIGIPMGITKLPETWFTLPANPFKYFLQIDFLGALKFAYIPFILSLFVPDFFSTFGTALGVGGKAGFLDEDGNLPGIDKVFKVDAISTVAGSLFCIPCMTTYLESSTGVESGGRTGLTVISTSVCFLLSLLITPIALMIPIEATAPALIIIGIGMLSAISKVKFDDYTEAFPAFACIAFTVFANNIANGICVAIPVYLVLKIASGKIKEIPVTMYILTAISFLYFYTIS